MWNLRVLQQTPPVGLPEDGDSRCLPKCWYFSSDTWQDISDYEKTSLFINILQQTPYKWGIYYKMGTRWKTGGWNATEEYILHTLVRALRNLTPRYDMANMMSGVPLASLVEDDFFSFWIDFLVDSVPLSSFTTVEPKYYRNQNKMTHFLTSYIGSKVSVTNINIRIRNQRHSKTVSCVGIGRTDPTHSSPTSWKWVLLVKLIVAQTVTKFLVFYEIIRFIFVCTTTHHRFLFWLRQI